MVECDELGEFGVNAGIANSVRRLGMAGSVEALCADLVDCVFRHRDRVEITQVIGPTRIGGSRKSHGVEVLGGSPTRSEEHTSELQSRGHLVCRLLLEKK